MMDDVKIVYHIDEEPTPYLIKVTPSDRSGKVVLGDFRAALNAKAHSYKYFFKAVDDDFGVVKEELIDDSSVLPCANGRIVAWLVTAESGQQGGGAGAAGAHYVPPPQAIRLTDSSQMQWQTGHGMQASAEVYEDDEDADTLDDEADEERQSVRDELAPLDAFDAYRARFGAAAASAMARSYQQVGHGHPHAAYYQQPYPVGVPVGVPPNMLVPRGQLDAASSLASSDVDETVSFLESEAESSRLSTATGTTTTMSWIAARGTRKQLRRRRKAAPISRASSFSSMTDSTMSLNIITVTLNVDTCNFLGISIVGQSSRAGGDGGIYVGSIMKGGAVAQDGRIEPGDMLLEVNGTSFECMSNDEAVRALRDAVSKPGPITLVVAKCWDARPSPKGYFTVPKQEPVRPIDPRAWIAHTQAAQQCGPVPQEREPQPQDSFGGSLHSTVPSSLPGHHAAPSTIIDSVSTAMEYRGGPARMPAPPHLAAAAAPPAASLRAPQFSSLQSQSLASAMFPSDPIGTAPASEAPGMPSAADGDSEADGELVRLNVHTDLAVIVQALAQPDSGLEIRDRIWLKITIENAFIGSDLVDWLYTHVDGLTDRRDAKKLAASLVRNRFIRHAVNKRSFSEKCYYVLVETAPRYPPMNPGNPPGAPMFTPSGPFGLPPVQLAPTPSAPPLVHVNDPTLDEIDSVSDIAHADPRRWAALAHVQRLREPPANPQSAAQALQQAYANAPVQPGAPVSNPYARYVSNPLFAAQTQQYATPTPPQPMASASGGPPPSYFEAQFANVASGSTAVQFADSGAFRDRTKTPAALSLTPSVRSAAADNCVCLKPLKSLLAAKENDLPSAAPNPSGPSSSSDPSRINSRDPKLKPVPPLRSALPRAPGPELAPDSASNTSSSSAVSANSEQAARRAAEQSQAVAMMSHFAANGSPHDPLERLPLANGNTAPPNPQQSSLYPQSALTQIATA